QAQILRHAGHRHDAALPPAERDLAHEAIGRTIEKLHIFHKHTFDLGLECARHPHRGFQRDGTGGCRAHLHHHPPPVFPDLGNVRNHSTCLELSPASLESLANLRERSAKDLSLSSTRRLTVPAGNRPSSFRSPALTPVRISMLSSTVAMG